VFSLPFKKAYTTLNLLEVSEKALRQNHAALQAPHPEARICPVLKSNAYGHGLATVTPVFDSFKAPFLVVDSLYEAYELTKLRAKTPILILGYTDPSNFSVKQLPYHVAVYNQDIVAELSKSQKHARIHLFVDTGMCREGIPLEELQTFIRFTKTQKNVEVVGLCSHLADADSSVDEKTTNMQYAMFKKALQIIRKEGIDPVWKHLSASAGSYTLFDTDVNMIRAGLASYGISPLDEKDPVRGNIMLHPALQFVSTLVQVKHIKKGSRIGYNGTYTASKNMTIGIIPAGYYEGVDRRLSNNGVVLIDGKPCAILGRISMNMTTINLSHVPKAKVGEPVVIYSNDSSQVNSFEKTAKIAGTIPYELLVHLAESVRRVRLG